MVAAYLCVAFGIPTNDQLCGTEACATTFFAEPRRGAMTFKFKTIVLAVMVAAGVAVAQTPTQQTPSQNPAQQAGAAAKAGAQKVGQAAQQAGQAAQQAGQAAQQQAQQPGQPNANPATNQAQPGQKMPKTASPLGLLAVLSLGSMSAGWLLRRRRVEG